MFSYIKWNLGIFKNIQRCVHRLTHRLATHSVSEVSVIIVKMNAATIATLLTSWRTSCFSDCIEYMVDDAIVWVIHYWHVNRIIWLLNGIAHASTIHTLCKYLFKSSCFRFLQCSVRVHFRVLYVCHRRPIRTQSQCGMDFHRTRLPSDCLSVIKRQSLPCVSLIRFNLKRKVFSFGSV